MGSLKDKSIKGVLWSAADKLGVKLITFVVGIIIARILTPADYGVIGMLMIFMTLSSILIDSGFSQAIVQKRNVDQKDLSTAFYFNIIVSAGCYWVLFFAAPAISRFYDMPLLTSVLRVLGINLVIISFATVQRATLIKHIDFKRIAFVNTSGAVASGFVGILMAYGGYGVWALVFQQISSQLVATVVYWIIGGWVPSFCFSVDSFRHLWRFGSKLLCAGMVASVFNELYSLFIGKYYKASELGYYRRAVDTTNLISGTAGEIINAVTFPILSFLQDDRTKMVEVYGRMLGMTAFFIFPIMTILAVVSKPFILVLLTDKWLLAVPLMQWLCIARMFTPVSALNMNILNATGRSDLFLKVDISKIPIMVAAMLITIPIGVKAVVIGELITTVICYFINAYLPGRLFNFGVKAQFRIFRRIIASTLVMVVVSSFVMRLINNDILQLAGGLVTGIIVYLVMCRITGVRELTDIIVILKSRLHINGNQ